MRVFILEDEIDKLPRKQITSILKNHTLTLTRSCEDAIKSYNPPYDLLLLDCDMRGIWGDHDHPNSGLQFVKWLVGKPIRYRPSVVLHSQNHIGAGLMRKLLEDQKIVVSEIPFGSVFVEWLRNL